jgi:hypothetical protein
MSSRNPVKLPHIHIETIAIAILLMVLAYVVWFL